MDDQRDNVDNSLVTEGMLEKQNVRPVGQQMNMAFCWGLVLVVALLDDYSVSTITQS